MNYSCLFRKEEKMRTLKNQDIQILFSSGEIKKKIEELAEMIFRDFQEILQKEKTKFKLVLVGVLNGTIIFLADLARALSQYFPLGIIEIDTIAISSYKGKHSGPLKMEKDTKYPIKNKHIIVVEDIVDTGKTIEEVIDILKGRKAKSIHICALVKKTNPQNSHLRIDYLGFLAPKEKWLIGYGLDLDGQGRELPYIGYLID